MITIIDYGAGNLFSVQNALNYLGLENRVSRDPADIRSASGLILPGVGAFPDAMRMLNAAGLTALIREEARRKPFLGICLGMQLLFDRSLEYGKHAGLGLIPGTVEPIREVIPAGYKVPHIGWNALHFPKDKPASPLFRYIREGDCVYFVHSYYGAHCQADTIATAEYGPELTAAVGRDNVLGVQFHPEKSGSVGLNILRAFCEGVGTC